MKRNLLTAEVRQVEPALSITDLFDGKGFAFDVVGASLNGSHGTTRNFVSDRAYFILEGNGTVHVGADQYTVVRYDLVTIPSNTPHSIAGVLTYLIITAPPFDPTNEQRWTHEH